MKSRCNIVYILALLAVAGCSGDTKSYRNVREQLGKTFEKDTMKLNASLILFENARLNTSYHGEAYEAYISTILSTRDDKDKQAESLKSLRSRQVDLTSVPDSTFISAAYLIDNINESFNTWQQAPWRDHISFENFCEYVLPYKMDLERPEAWRSKIFSGIPDSLREVSDIKRACYGIAKMLSEPKTDFKILFGEKSLFLPPMPYSALKELRSGACDDITRYGIYSLRAYGFPIAKDFTPHWANRSSGHTWCALVLDSGKSVPFNFPIEKWYPYLGNYKWSNRLESKVYRQTATINPNSHAVLRGRVKGLPEMFNDSRIVDVTDKYVPVANVDIPVKRFGENDVVDSFAYIAVYADLNWSPVGWGKVINDSAGFEKIVKGCVYLPAFFSEARLVPFGYPFAVVDNELKIFKPDSGKVQSITLTRKYPLFSDIQRYTRHMINGKFQGANKPDFSDSVDVHVITEDPGVYYNEIKINTKKKFKYYRYKGAFYTWSNVGDIELYVQGQSKPARGEIMGAEGSNAGRNPNVAFDGDPLTFYEAKDWNAGWAGMSFSEPVALDKIRFIARTDYNIIVEGNTYELIYWDHGWKSLGRQIATSNKLVYDNVPVNALFLLRNHTAGKEERIFTYENGNQVWW